MSGAVSRAAAVTLVLVVLGAGTAIAWWAGAFRAQDPSGVGEAPPPTATQPVAREDLSSVVPVNATLGYANSYTVLGQGGGTLTWLPSPGRVITQGQVLYRVDNGSPVALLYGSVPDWRTLEEGLTGADVTQLNHDLVALGYADGSDIGALGWDYFSWETAYGVQRMESALGAASPPGSLPIGSVAFEPTAIRVTTVAGSLGGPATGPVLSATSDQDVVTIPLSTAQESEVAVGDAVTVTLPDGGSTPGTISSVAAVASGSAGNATIPVTVTLTRPSAARSVEQAPVTVYITTASSPGPVLAVPVAALLAQSPGGYAVEVIGAGGTRRLVPVTVGIFNDNSGLVQVTGALTPGQRVVVPAT
jgi:multidrug efflux pump subunit AcrA (membrane-fusion protein)